MRSRANLPSPRSYFPPSLPGRFYSPFFDQLKPAGDDLEGSAGLLVVGLDLIPSARFGSARGGGGTSEGSINVDAAAVLVAIAGEEAGVSKEALSSLSAQALQAGIDEQMRCELIL